MGFSRNNKLTMDKIYRNFIKNDLCDDKLRLDISNLFSFKEIAHLRKYLKFVNDNIKNGLELPREVWATEYMLNLIEDIILSEQT